MTPMTSLQLHRGASRVFSALLLFAASHCAVAQTDTEAVVISKVDVHLVTAPAISYSGAPSKLVASKKWMEIETTFAWQPLSGTDFYSDDLTVDYYVLLKNPSIKYPEGALLTGKTALSGVPAKSLDQKNGELKTVIYLSPRQLERLFNGRPPSDENSAVNDIGVTISKQGKVIAQKSLHGNLGWWSLPKYQQTPGFLLNKSETPFAALNWDYYEAVKKQP